MNEHSAHLTQHAIERARERAGWTVDALQKMADRALEEGMTHAEARGQLKRYLDALYLRHGTANNLRIHGLFVFVFHASTLITFMHVPANLRLHVAHQRQSS